jgi:hypothetical protein
MQTSPSEPGDKRPPSGLKRLADADRLSDNIFTAGHSNHEVSRFVELLGRAGIRTVLDVRSSPFSQRLPQFNQPELKRELQTSGMGYVFLGDELGGRPTEVAVYDGEGRVDYWRVRRTLWFRKGIERLLDESRRGAVALVCAEEDPLDCHRALMITAELAEQGVHARHLRGNGTIETNAQLETRLFEITGIGGGMATGLFAATLPATERAELLTEAYRTQANRKSFRLQPGQNISEIDSISESFLE